MHVEILPEHPAFGDAGASSLVVTPAHAGDAGIDLIACEPAILAPGDRVLVSAGIRIALPEGLEAQVRPRSGQALKRGLTIPNSPGTIDPGYRGPVKVILLNTAAALCESDLVGIADGGSVRLAEGIRSRTIRIERGERIAQLVFARFERPAIRVVESVSVETTRGEGGFGSTGAG